MEKSTGLLYTAVRPSAAAAFETQIPAQLNMPQCLITQRYWGKVMQVPAPIE
jgi:hypothetical protein